ncbi:DoxX family protein [Burkholderia sp. Ac-20344]|uniref:DoxX family protein n=1 Tax=Burkholderia sp. Ac-20344 TaxID=2703890 RepID=UPI003217E0FE
MRLSPDFEPHVTLEQRHEASPHWTTHDHGAVVLRQDDELGEAVDGRVARQLQVEQQDQRAHAVFDERVLVRRRHDFEASHKYRMLLDCQQTLNDVSFYKRNRLYVFGASVVRRKLAHEFHEVRPSLARQLRQTYKNIAIAGGLIALCAAGPGRFSVDRG